jgi:hypothetical protein
VSSTVTIKKATDMINLEIKRLYMGIPASNNWAVHTKEKPQRVMEKIMPA